MSIHDGHRKRLKDLFAKHGERALTDHQLLELLLFYCIPQGDVNPLAHRLIDRFGSLSAVMDANLHDLKQVDGIGDHAALFLTMLPQVMRRYGLCRTSAKALVRSTADAGEFLKPYFFGARNELAYILCLSSRGKVLACDFLAEGCPDRVSVDHRKILETALLHRACSVILAHNHVNGIAIASDADIAFTQALRPLLKAANIHLLDHLIFADDNYLSLAKTGLYRRD